MNQLTVIEIDSAPEANNLPQLPAVFEAANLEALYRKVADEVSAEVPDVATPEGRARIKSLAAKISSSKTAIDKPIRDHLRCLKAIPKVLEQNARESIERFDALRDSTLAPLEAAQAEQDAKLAMLADVLTKCQSYGVTAAMVEQWQADVASIDVASFWPELTKKAKAAHETATVVTAETLARLQREEAQAAELERLRAEAAAREQADRDRKIAEAAAESARLQAEQRAQQEREAVERRAVEAKQREESQRMEAERQRQLAEQAEQRRIQAEAQAKLDAEEAKKRAEMAAQKAAEQAAEAERKRIAEEAAEAKRLAQAREADKEHRIKINRAALVALVAEGLSEDDAKKAITAIAKGLVPNVRITY